MHTSWCWRLIDSALQRPGMLPESDQQPVSAAQPITSFTGRPSTNENLINQKLHWQSQSTCVCCSKSQHIDLWLVQLWNNIRGQTPYRNLNRCRHIFTLVIFSVTGLKVTQTCAAMMLTQASVTHTQRDWWDQVAMCAVGSLKWEYRA